MSVQSTTPTARKRRRKTRTRNVSSRPALALSSLHLAEVELFPGKEHIRCPDCGTWCPITGCQGRQPKLVPHDDAPLGTPGSRPCSRGSNRLVVLDISLAQWQKRRSEGPAEVESRRSTTVRRKPKTPAAPAATRMVPAPLSWRNAREAFHAHRSQCDACKGKALNSDGARLACPYGQRLADAYVRLLRQEPKRSQTREAFARERARFDRRYAQQARRNNAAAWQAQYEATDGDRTQLAKRAGTAVEEQSNTCKITH